MTADYPKNMDANPKPQHKLKRQRSFIIRINQQMPRVMQETIGDGHGFSDTCSGIKKAIEAESRVIPETSDQGYLWLLDQRTEHPQIK